jgi:hypothetical protein
MGADRTLMQVKVRCGLGRVGVFGRLYGNSREMSAPGQLRRFNRVPTTSALPPKADIRRTGWQVPFVPYCDIQVVRCRRLSIGRWRIKKTAVTDRSTPL